VPAYFVARKRVVDLCDLFWLKEAHIARLALLFPKSNGKLASMINVR
jgi:hypothetical protein